MEGNHHGPPGNRDSLKDRLYRGGGELLRAIFIYNCATSSPAKTLKEKIMETGEVITNLSIRIVIPYIIFGPMGAACGSMELMIESGAAIYTICGYHPTGPRGC